MKIKRRKRKRKTKGKYGRKWRPKVGHQRTYYRDPYLGRPDPRQQPEFHPITGQRIDQPVPPIEKVVYRYVPRPRYWVPGYKGKIPTHEHKVFWPVPEWEGLASVAANLAMPATYIIRLAVRRFLRAYRMVEVIDAKGRTAKRMTIRRIFTRAEQEILGQSSSGPFLYRVEGEERAMLDEQRRRQLMRELKIYVPKPKNPVPENFKDNVAQILMRKREREAKETEATEAERKLAEAEARETKKKAANPPPPPAARQSLSAKGRRLFITPKKPPSS